MHTKVMPKLLNIDARDFNQRLQLRIAEKVLELHEKVNFRTIHEDFIFDTKEDFEKFQQLSREIKLDVDIMNLHSYTLKNVISKVQEDKNESY